MGIIIKLNIQVINIQMFGKDLQKDNFLNQLGSCGLHPFISGLRSQGINKINDLKKKKTIEEIKEIGNKIEMPSSAIDRLLEILNKEETHPAEKNFKVESSNKKDIKNDKNSNKAN